MLDYFAKVNGLAPPLREGEEGGPAEMLNLLKGTAGRDNRIAKGSRPTGYAALQNVLLSPYGYFQSVWFDRDMNERQRKVKPCSPAHGR